MEKENYALQVKETHPFWKSVVSVSQGKVTSYEFFQVRIVCIAGVKVTSDRLCLAMVIYTLQETGTFLEFFWEKVTLVEQEKMMQLGQGTLVHAFRKYAMLEESVQNRVTYVP